MTDLLERLEEAKSLEVQGKYAESGETLSDLIQIAQQSNDALLASLLNHRGIVKRMLRRYDESLADYKAALKASQSNEQKAFAHINIADIQRVAQSDFPAAHCSLDEALTYSENGSIMHAKAVDQRGLVFVAQRDYSSAIEAYKTARKVCEALMESKPADKDTENRFGQTVHHLGVAYVLLNDPKTVDEAYESQVTALKIFTRLRDQQGIVNTVATMGKIAEIKKDYDEAIKQYERAFEILNKTGYERGITSLALDLAEAHLQKNQPEKAMPYLERFRNGVLDGEVTGHDVQLLRDQFNNLVKLYDSVGLSVDRFEKVKSQFR